MTDAIKDRDAFKQECIAEAVTEFWRESYPTLVGMIAEMLPHQIALQDYLKEHPGLAQNEQFLGHALEIKRQNPNTPLLELLEAARQKTGEQKPE